MTKNELKERVYAAIDRRAEEIVRLGARRRRDGRATGRLSPCSVSSTPSSSPGIPTAIPPPAPPTPAATMRRWPR